MEDHQKEFDYIEGKLVDLYTLKNSSGVEAFLNKLRGCIVASTIKVVRANGSLHGVVIGFECLDD